MDVDKLSSRTVNKCIDSFRPPEQAGFSFFIFLKMVLSSQK